MEQGIVCVIRDSHDNKEIRGITLDRFISITGSNVFRKHFLSPPRRTPQMITLTKENLSLLIKALHHYNILTKNSQTIATETVEEELRKLASKWSNLEFLAHNANA